MHLRIIGSDLPGLACGAADGFPGYEHIHVAVQRRNRPGELLGLVPGDAASARWDLECDVVETAGGVDFKGPYVSGRPHERFVYLSWGTLADDGTFTMFRRAKLWLDAVDRDVVDAAASQGRSSAGSASPTVAGIHSARRSARRPSGGPPNPELRIRRRAAARRSARPR